LRHLGRQLILYRADSSVIDMPNAFAVVAASGTVA